MSNDLRMDSPGMAPMNMEPVGMAPQCYKIRVRGVLDPGWSARMGGLHIAVERCEDGRPETVLSGELPDQAALHGVISALYTLGNPLVSVGTC